jgi:hypothetical protein
MTPRFNLNHQEIASLVTTFVADGRWNNIGLNEIEGEQYLLDFIASLLQKDDPERITKTIYLGMQNTLMALRKDDFLTIQEEPPFSPFSRHNFDKLLRAWIANGKSGYTKEFRQIFNPAGGYQKPKQEITTYSGGPGYSRENAVIIHANDKELGVNTEYWYLYYTYGRNWRPGTQRLTTPDSEGRRFDVIDINFPTGETKSIYFDITEFFGRRG